MDTLYEVHDTHYDACRHVYFTTEAEARAFCEAEKKRVDYRYYYKRLPMSNPQVERIEVFTTAADAEERLGTEEA